MDIATVFLNINKIIERESKSSTYKFALLRGTIELIQENSPYIQFHEDKVVIPLGLLMEKWLLYYFPLFANPARIKQISSSPQLAIEPHFLRLIDFYKSHGGFSAFANDIRYKGIAPEFLPHFSELSLELARTIIRMPMYYLGQSLHGTHNAIFQMAQPVAARKGKQIPNKQALIDHFGTFSIPVAYYEGFRLFGSFINGQDSILMKWALLSEAFTGPPMDAATVLGNLLQSPTSKREVQVSKKVFEEHVRQFGPLHCVWTGRKVGAFVIDHVIPYAIWRNNDLWNLLPTSDTINKAKRDSIPSPDLIESRKDCILDYWDLLKRKNESQFHAEIKVALLGDDDKTDWKTVAINRLKSTSQYLIDKRGFAEWNHGK